MTAFILTNWSGEQIARFIAPRLLADHPFVSLKPRWTRMSSGASRSSAISEVR
jgi:hypothetical protein